MTVTKTEIKESAR